MRSTSIAPADVVQIEKVFMSTTNKAACDDSYELVRAGRWALGSDAVMSNSFTTVAIKVAPMARPA